MDLLNTEAHNERLDGTLKVMDEEVTERGRVIEKQELDMRRRNDEIAKKTREVDVLNRKYERLVADKGDENTGGIPPGMA